MAQLKVLHCKTCTAPLPEGVLKCPKCGTVNKLATPEAVNPLKFTKDMAAEYIQYFQEATKKNPKDTNSLFGMGLVYLGLKNYELAQRNFKEAVDLSPLEPDTYYYYALSLFEGKNPAHIEPGKANKIEEWLHTASNYQPKRKYLTLLLVLRQCAFVGRGLQVKGEQPLELMESIRKMMPEADDVAEIRQHVQITDAQTNKWLDEIQSGVKKAESKADRERRYSQQTYSYVGRIPIGRDKDDEVLTYPDDPGRSIQRLENEGEREMFFDFMYQPDEPVIIGLPHYPWGKLLKHLILMPLGVFIMLIIMVSTNFGMMERELDKETRTVQQEYNERFGKRKLSAAEKKQKIAEIKAKRAEEARLDSIFNADYYIYARTYKTADDETKNYWFGADSTDPTEKAVLVTGIDKSWKGLVAIGLVLLPLIIGILRILVNFGRVSYERHQITEENTARQMDYNAAMFNFQDRPSIADYVLFCRNYLSKDSNLLSHTGDPVTKALQDNRIDELDMAGKILFVNYFDDEDEDGNYSEEPHDILSRVYYVVAIPQRDKLTLLHNYWDTTSNQITSCDAENIFYRQITGVQKKGNEIHIEKVGGERSVIVLPPENQPSLFSYQSEFHEVISYSNTRTSDPQEFIDALSALAAAYK